MACGGCAKRARVLAGLRNRPAAPNTTTSQTARVKQRLTVVAKHLARDIRRSTLGTRR